MTEKAMQVSRAARTHESYVTIALRGQCYRLKESFLPLHSFMNLHYRSGKGLKLMVPSKKKKSNSLTMINKNYRQHKLFLTIVILLELLYLFH